MCIISKNKQNDDDAQMLKAKKMPTQDSIGIFNYVVIRD